MKLVLVVESPLSTRDEQRFGVEAFQAAGFEVEVWEICDLTLPDSRRQSIEKPRLVTPIRVRFWSELVVLSKQLAPDDSVILHCGVYGVVAEKYEPLLLAILGSPAAVGAAAIGTIPSAPGLTGLRARIHWARRRSHDRLRPVFKLPRKLDFVWAGTTCSGVACALRGSDTIIRYVHALDYDLAIRARGKPNLPGPFVLVLDAGGPAHPDYVTVGSGNPWQEDQYETVVRETLESLESHSFRLVIGAHPRSKPEELERVYQGREILYGNIAAGVRDCDFVVTVEGSTALGLAAYYGKQVVFVDHSSIPDSIRELADNFRRALGSSRLVPSLHSCGFVVPPINPRKYDEYVRRYVKQVGSPDMYFWSFVGGDLLRWHSVDRGI